MRLSRPLIIAVAAACCAQPVFGHETDQFTTPVNREFADLGRYFNEMMFDCIDKAVVKVNGKIQQALNRGDRAAAERLQTPETIAGAVFDETTPAYFLIEGLEAEVHSDKMKRRFPGRVTGYKEQFTNVYQHVHFILDPRQVMRIWHASTIKIYGVYCGTDKIGHFTDMGMNYYKPYRAALRKGASESEALAKAVDVGVTGLLFAETGAVGYISAGDYSNADLASNYAGFLFYKNLTDETMIQGKMHPPLLTLENDLWKIATHVRRDNDFFAAYITDHFNEALNPGLFERGMRKPLRKAVAKRAENILRRYADPNGQPRTKEYFDRQVAELAKYYGEEYGYRGEYDNLISVGNTCFSATGEPAAVAGLWGNSSAHFAAQRGGSVEVQDAAALDARNFSGATPLHCAAGHADVIGLLLERNADAKAKDRRGQTPLHWAARVNDAPGVEKLLAGGAQVDAADSSSCTALHHAARMGNAQAAAALLARGAKADATDMYGVTPLHIAAAEGHADAIDALLAGHAAVDAKDQFGMTALHEASRRGHTEIAQAIIAAGADIRAADASGNTPLHLAARYGHGEIVTLLLERGAERSAKNRMGKTPAEEAVFSGSRDVVALLRASTTAAAR